MIKPSPEILGSIRIGGLVALAVGAGLMLLGLICAAWARRKFLVAASIFKRPRFGAGDESVMIANLIQLVDGGLVFLIFFIASLSQLVNSQNWISALFPQSTWIAQRPAK